VCGENFSAHATACHNSPEMWLQVVNMA